ncbi:M48 family metallopeptidase [Aquimarina sp. W85]|uniref:M48 family metallopeptidase n=1 Tax=Aquimarina rhodophyticola TaxID=3342246 RepID=UPI00366E384A
MVLSPTSLFYVIITIILVVFLVDTFLDYLNAKQYSNPIPKELDDIYEKDEHQKSINYKRANYQFKTVSSIVSLILLLIFLYFNGFAYLDHHLRTISNNPIVLGLLFIGSLLIVSDLLALPFDYYRTFVIEERFGFNTTTKKTFFMDKLKGLLLLIFVGGGLLSLIIWFYQLTKENFWIYAWLLISFFTILMNMFYAKLFVPLFNDQTPLEAGTLRDELQKYATNVGFKLKDIYVIDGSKRSTKANAYFSGLGSEKRITLYDTLIKDLDTEEVVAVLAHEVGHYKKGHIVINLALSILLTCFTFWLLAYFIDNPVLAQAFGVSNPSFHIGLIAFGILFSPISEITGLLMNIVSRKFEYQADNFAKKTYARNFLISSLKKLSKNNLSNLTPHPATVFVHYSHPTLLQRIKNLRE